MKENLVKIRINKHGEMEHGVSEAVKELTYEEMNELRAALCSVISLCEDLYLEGER